MLDVHAIDSSNTDTVLLLVVLHPLAEVLVSLLRIAGVAAAITAGPSVLLYELQCDIEIVRSDILTQDKAVAVTEQDHSPDNIGFVFDKHTSCKKIKPAHSLMFRQTMSGLRMVLCMRLLDAPRFQQGYDHFLHLLGGVFLRTFSLSITVTRSVCSLSDKPER